MPDQCKIKAPGYWGVGQETHYRPDLISTLPGAVRCSQELPTYTTASPGHTFSLPSLSRTPSRSFPRTGDIFEMLG